MENKVLIQFVTLLLIISLSVVVSYWGVNHVAFIQILANWENDIRYATLQPAEPQHPEIVVITITEETLEQFQYRSPVDRKFISDLLINLESKDVKGIFLDLLFDQPTEKDKDKVLFNTIRALEVPLVISYSADSSGLVLTKKQAAYHNEFIPENLRGLANLGKDDYGHVRWIYPGDTDNNGNFIPGVISALIAKINNTEVARLPEQLRFAWHGAPDTETYAFRSYPAHIVPFLPQDWFDGKIILIGSELSITDRHRTPFSIEPEFRQGATKSGTPGIYIHANALAQLLGNRSFPEMKSHNQMMLLVVAAILGALFSLIKNTYYVNVILTLVSVVIFWIAGFYIFKQAGVLVPLVGPTLSLSISYLFSLIYVGRKAEVEKVFAVEETKLKSQFLANMSHEIRSPMNAIIGMTELVLESNINKQQQGYLKTVLASARALLALINDILDLSKLESGKMDIENIVFDLTKMLNDTVATLSVQAQSKGLDILLDVDESMPPCLIGDPLRLRQVVLNLAGNSVKFTESGSVKIKVTRYDEDRDFLHFSVIDTGIGIAPDRQAAIFESFTQAEGSTSRKHGGTGLGTTISKQIVEKMQGKIWVESELGSGSTFHFIVNMPIAQGVESCDVEYGFSGQQDIQADRSFSVLLAEDIEENIELASIRLKQRHHRVTVARNGREAFELVQQNDFDIVLMDVQMPEMDGFESTMNIRAFEQEMQQSRHTPIVAMTANAMKGDREKCLAAGMDDYVSKPINFDELFSTMEKVIAEDGGIPVEQVVAQEDVEIVGMETEIAGIPALYGVDLETGMTVWGNAEVYKKSLISFAKGHADDTQKIAAFYDQAQYHDAKMVSHALKGVAGNLSIIKLAEKASLLDAALSEKAADWKHLLVETAEELDKVIASINENLLGTAADAGTMASDLQNSGLQMQLAESDDGRQLIALLEGLFATIEKGNITDADGILERLDSEFVDILPNGFCNHVKSSLDDFDFDQAQRLILALCDVNNIQLEKNK